MNKFNRCSLTRTEKLGLLATWCVRKYTPSQKLFLEVTELISTQTCLELAGNPIVSLWAVLLVLDHIFYLVLGFRCTKEQCRVIISLVRFTNWWLRCLFFLYFDFASSVCHSEAASLIIILLCK